MSSSNLFKATKRIVSAVKSGKIIYARKVFDEMPVKDTVAWNAMLSSYAHLGNYPQVFSLFNTMRLHHTPDHFTFTATLSACASEGDLKCGSALHGLVVVCGCVGSIPVGNSLVDMYGKCMRPGCAQRVFDEMGLWNEVSWCSLLFSYMNFGVLGVGYEVFCRMPKRVVVSWNIMIAGYARHGEWDSCFSLFREMRGSGCCPDQWTLSSLINACGRMEKPVQFGRMIHAFVVKTGWDKSAEVQNSLLSFYNELGSHVDVSKALDSMECWNQVSWNSAIDAHMNMGNTLDAYSLFQKMPEKNVVSWTSMVAGFARNGQESEAVWLFVHMIRDSVKPDKLAFGVVLHACSGLSLLGHGLMIHGCLRRHGFNDDAYVGNGLVNMYAKCGDLQGASKAFDDVINKDIVSWNTMLFAYGLHGQGNQTLQLYEEMLACGIKPDAVTFIGLLMTCSHTGFIEKGKSLLESMSSDHGLSHEMHHVACILDMLGRGGFLAEAKLLANELQGMKDLKGKSSEAMLGVSSINIDVELAKHFGEDMMILDPQDEMSYVLLSNLYCASGQWKKSEIVRKAMANQGVRKMPGCSWIEVKNESTNFVSGDCSHQYIDEICKLIGNLELELKYPCFPSCGK